MSVPAGLVVTVTAVVASPLLWLVHEGAVPLDVAVQRLVVCLAASWLLLAVVSKTAFAPLHRPPTKPAAPEAGAAPEDATTPPAPAQITPETPAP